MCLSSRLHNSNFFSLPWNRTSDLWRTPFLWSPPHQHHVFLRACCSPLNAAGGITAYYSLAGQVVCPSPQGVCPSWPGLSSSGSCSAWFTTTPDPSLQSCYPGTVPPSHGYSHLSEGKRGSVRMHTDAAGANLPKFSTVWYNPGRLCRTGGIGRERIQNDMTSVFHKFKTS